MDSSIVMFPICAVLSGITLAYKFRDLRRDPRNRGLRAICAALAGACLAFTINWPPIYVWLDTGIGEPNIAKLLVHATVIGVSAAVVATLAYWGYPEAEARAKVRYATWLFVGVLGVMATLFFSASLPAPTTDFATVYGRQPVITAYLIVYLSAFALACLGIMLLCLHIARQAAHRKHLRRGMRITALGGVWGIAYALYKIGHVVALHFDILFGRDSLLSPILAGMGAIFVLIGLTLPSLAPVVARLRADLHQYRQHRQLHVLWRVLYKVAPKIALTPPRSLLQDYLDPRDLEFRLLRKTVEINDGIFELRDYIDPRAVAIARTHARAAGLTGADEQAAVTAAVLTVALRAARARQPVAEPYEEPLLAGIGAAKGTSGDLASEIKNLRRIARAWRWSPVTRRTIADLRKPQPVEARIDSQTGAS